MLITLDDGWQDNYTNALPITNAAGLQATMYLITGNLDAVGYVTTAQAQEMIAAGWTIGNHSQTHTPMTSMNYAEALAELQAAIADLQALGGSPYHYAYPGGAIANEDAVVDAGILTARTSDAVPQFGLPSMNPQHLVIRSVTNAVSVATVTGWIDDAIATKKVLILLFHQISTPADTTYKTTVADFQSIVTYLAGTGASVLTIDELWSAYSAY